MVKRYLVFAYHEYYPGGGWGDFQFSADTEDEAKARIKEEKRHFDFWEIVDLETETATTYELPLLIERILGGESR